MEIFFQELATKIFLKVIVETPPKYGDISDPALMEMTGGVWMA